MENLNRFFLLTACRDDPKPPVNVVPDVQITSHQDGDIVTAGEQITLTAAASDAEDGLRMCTSDGSQMVNLCVPSLWLTPVEKMSVRPPFGLELPA